MLKVSKCVIGDQKGSRSYNRNYYLDRADGDIIILMDDDITGFYDGWEQDLIKPLEDNSISIVSARLVDEQGKNIPMMFDGTKYNIVPTGCIAFRKTGVRFDENYTEYGYEDTDFCRQMELIYPNKKTLINNNCKLVHLTIDKGIRSKDKSRRYFLNKWGWVHSPKKMDKTIIYYTANTEGELENKVIDNILMVKGALPIISVSQKPMELGVNICVGDVGQTYLNAFRQLLIGCEKATTDFVIMAESDCLYPSTGYFDFIPTDKSKVYSYDNVWILYNNQFHNKGQTQGSMIFGREWLINFLKECLKGCPEWSREKVAFPFFKPDQQFEHFTGLPIINVKTGKGVNKKRMPNFYPQDSLPYWGTVEEVKKNYLL
jgi:glycosyltransferase involved in cell wall biosynthesis